VEKNSQKLASSFMWEKTQGAFDSVKKDKNKTSCGLLA
jgi:hypothetical protein